MNTTSQLLAGRTFSTEVDLWYSEAVQPRKEGSKMGLPISSGSGTDVSATTATSGVSATGAGTTTIEYGLSKTTQYMIIGIAVIGVVGLFYFMHKPKAA